VVPTDGTMGILAAGCGSTALKGRTKSQGLHVPWTGALGAGCKLLSLPTRMSTSYSHTHHTLRYLETSAHTVLWAECFSQMVNSYTSFKTHPPFALLSP
jgi:hypothetical protein